MTEHIIIVKGDEPDPLPSDEQMKSSSKKEWCVLHANYYYHDCTICLLVKISQGHQDLLAAITQRWILPPEGPLTGSL